MTGWQDFGDDLVEGVSSLFRGWFVVEMFYPEDIRTDRKIRRSLQRSRPPPRKSAQPNLRRRRALTSILSTLRSEQSAHVQVIDRQPQSLLLSKLPPEMRQLIWKECLGGMTFHLRVRNRKLIHVPCASPEPASCNSEQGALGCYNHLYYRTKGNLLALLHTCRYVLVKLFLSLL
jgi:hypothetical protein